MNEYTKSQLQTVALSTDIFTATVVEQIATDLSSAVSAVVAANHTHANKAVIDAITSEKVTQWDSALTGIAHGTDGTYVTTTVGEKSSNSQSVGVAVTTHTVEDAVASTADGLAVASDVKSYVDSQTAAQDITIATGTADGTISVKKGNAAAADVAVQGLKSAAYTLSTEYDLSGAAATAKSEVIGANTDLSSADTVWGAKAYAEDYADVKVAEEVAKVINGAPEAFDTLKEIADWISDDQTGVSSLVNRISALETNKADLSTLTANYATKSELTTGLADKADVSAVYTKSEVDTALGDKVDTADLTAYYTKSEVDTALGDKVSKVLITSLPKLATDGSISASDIVAKVNSIIDAITKAS